MQQNNFKNIPSSLAGNLTRLNTLNISGNKIKEIRQSDNRLLKQLSNFNAYSNDINSIDQQAFDGCSNLATINLESNALTTPLARWFKSLGSLRVLKWEQNPWVCNCQALPFYELTQKGDPNSSLDYAISDTVKCYRPNEVSGQYIDNLNATYLAGVDGQNGPCVYTTPASRTTSAPQDNSCPAGCACYDNNAVVDCTGAGLNDTYFPVTYPKNTEVILLNKNRFTAIPQRAFISLTKLRAINFDENYISEIPVNVFPNTLTNLKVSNNKLTNVNSGSLPSKLTDLNLSRNQIVNITLPRLTRLNALDLSYNQISQLNVASNYQFTTVYNINLKYNQFTTVPTMFNGLNYTSILPSLALRADAADSQFNIGYNQLTQINANDLAIDVAEIDISGNNIKSISSNAFKAGQRTVNFKLDDNQVQSLNNCVSNLQSLTTLTANDNLISSISKTDLPQNLTNLALGGNQLTSVPLQQLPSTIQTLNLEGNKITSLSSSSPAQNSNLQNLQIIILTGNQVGSINNSWLKDCPSLIEIILNNMGLTEFPSDLNSAYQMQIFSATSNKFNQINLLGSWPALSQLYLNNNNISSLPDNLFDKLTSLQVLNLSNNQLVTPLARWFYQIRSLSELQWFYNPWQCDCNSIPFAQLLESEKLSFKFRRTLQDTVLCQGPPEFANQYIDNVGVAQINDQLNCYNFTEPVYPPTPFPDTCPDACVCERKFGKFITDCSSRNLTAIPGKISRNTNVLYLNDNFLNSLDKTDFEGLPNLLTLNISSNSLTDISPRLFSKLNSLEELYLRNNFIGRIYSDSWPLDLVLLDLSFNDLTEIKNFEGFDNLAYLQNLILSHNKISKAQGGFDGLSNIYQIDLSYNRLENFPALSPSADNLQVLMLDNNRILNLAYSGSAVWSNMRFLSVNYNLVNLISGPFTTAFPALTSFSVNNNNLTNLPNLLLPQLYTLDLNENSFTDIANTFAFKNCSSLSTLNINGNQLTSIPSAILNVVNQLSSLSLNKNKIKDLGTAGPFDSSNLSEINLNNNLLNQNAFDNNWITSIPNLSVLSLQFNELSAIPALNPGLLILNLKNNAQIKSIQSNDLKNLKQLLNLELDKCYISNIDLDAFDDLTALSVLTLEENDLTTPKARWFKNLVSLQQLSWDQNPWNCDCASIPFKVLLDQNTNVHRAITDTVQCYTPQNFTGQYIDDVDISDLNAFGTCITPTATLPETTTPTANYDCPSECFCSKNNTIVNCNEKGLTYVPSMPMTAEIINFNYNNLTSYTTTDFYYLPNLRELNINFSNLRSLTANAFAPTAVLSSFSAQGNNLNQQTDFTKAFNNNLKSLVLSNSQITGNVTFFNFKGLQTLNLENNAITQVNTSNGKSFYTLQELLLDSNQLTALPAVYSPEKCSSNNKLSLNNNQIQSLTGTINFYVYQLNIENNGLENIAQTYFGGEYPFCVGKLFLGYNKLQSIRGLNSCTNLNYIDLTSNQLQGLPPLTSTKLQLGYFASNQINFIDVDNLPSTVFYLDVSNNGISTLPVANNRTNLFNLNSLYLQKNQITTFSNSFLSECTHLTSLRTPPWRGFNTRQKWGTSRNGF